MPRKRNIGFCKIDGCERPLKTFEYCQYHYNKKRLAEKPERARAGLRGHPFYHLWFERKQNGLLCDKWLDFKLFVWDIGNKPEGEFFLVRTDANRPFGPDNFKWVEHLRRKPDENNSDWNARKLEARKQTYPNLDSDRNIKRQYGLSRAEYDEKLKHQNYVCAICGEPETALDGKSGVLKRLAVDHCHKTTKNRDLLCWRCNTTLGKIGEDLELLKKIENYIIKHKEDI